MVRRGRPRLPNTGDVGVDGRVRAERGGLLQRERVRGRERETQTFESCCPIRVQRQNELLNFKSSNAEAALRR